jgi:hypothetical protein
MSVARVPLFLLRPADDAMGKRFDLRIGGQVQRGRPGRQPPVGFGQFLKGRLAILAGRARLRLQLSSFGQEKIRLGDRIYHWRRVQVCVRRATHEAVTMRRRGHRITADAGAAATSPICESPG